MTNSLCSRSSSRCAFTNGWPRQERSALSRPMREDSPAAKITPAKLGARIQRIYQRPREIRKKVQYSAHFPTRQGVEIHGFGSKSAILGVLFRRAIGPPQWRLH